ncbi:hypothetical protein COCCADRAFT_97885, partial [Bipolaris zeicola 26-R-13]
TGSTNVVLYEVFVEAMNRHPYFTLLVNCNDQQYNDCALSFHSNTIHSLEKPKISCCSSADMLERDVTQIVLLMPGIFPFGFQPDLQLCVLC